MSPEPLRHHLHPPEIPQVHLSRPPSRKGERLIIAFLWLSAGISIFVVGGVIFLVVVNVIPFFQQVSPGEFFTGTRWTPLFTSRQFGVLPLVMGTLLTSGIGMLIALPVGVLIAILLNEYFSERLRTPIKSLLEILAFIPTVVYGYFALILVTPFLQRFIPDLQIFNALSAGIVMAFMLLPIIASISDDAIRAVPHSLREAGYGLGASTWQVTFRVVLPAARNGILAGALLALIRALGETMLVTIAAGQTPNFTLDPRNPVQTLTSYIVQVAMGDVPYGSLEHRSIYAVVLVLMLLVSSASLTVFWLRRKSPHRS